MILICSCPAFFHEKQNDLKKRNDSNVIVPERDHAKLVPDVISRKDTRG